jgi:4'-phosphopantetheinyl transferase
MGRALPDAAATLILTRTEMTLLDCLVPSKRLVQTARQTLSAYLTKVARLGGYLARGKDPPPGNTVMWRGLFAPAAQMLEELRDFLDCAELHALQRLQREGDVCAYLAAHAGLRRLLAAALDCEASELRFGRGPQGKPFIVQVMDRPSIPPLHFNLSHTQGRVAVALSSSPVGIDVEAVMDLPDIMSVARSAFAEEALVLLAASGINDRTRLFYRFWVLSEAFIKATGLGVSQGLDSFAFSASDPPRLVRVTRGWGPAERWRFGLVGANA